MQFDGLDLYTAVMKSCTNTTETSSSTATPEKESVTQFLLVWNENFAIKSLFFYTGECGIEIRHARSRHHGHWRCTIIRDDPSSASGTEVAKGKILLDLEGKSSSSFSDYREETFQGHRAGDRNVKIRYKMDVSHEVKQHR